MSKIMTKKILVLGSKGYIGFPLLHHLLNLGHDVIGIDSGIKDKQMKNLGVKSLFEPISTNHNKVISTNREELLISKLKKLLEDPLPTDVRDYEGLSGYVKIFKPDVIVHLAEQPSAPYSEIDMEKSHETLMNNVESTFNIARVVKEVVPECHIVKLGTMGEFGNPNIDIEEGYLDVDHNGRKETFLYPRSANSLYHTSKIMDTDLLSYYCRVHNLRVSDIMQGPVYGFDTDTARTSFYYDDVFGTVLNRFLVQAIVGEPLTIYGSGGQTKGFINLKDVMKCVELIINNPTEKGNLEIYNQFTEVYSVKKLAELVKEAGDEIGLNVKINNLENPRKEPEEHYFNPKNQKLLDLGLESTKLSKEIIQEMLLNISKYKLNIDKSKILPSYSWK